MDKQQGFGVLGIIIAIVVIGVVGFSGWYVWNRNQVASTNSAVSTAESTTEEIDSNAQLDKDLENTVLNY